MNHKCLDCEEVAMVYNTPLNNCIPDPCVRGCVNLIETDCVIFSGPSLRCRDVFAVTKGETSTQVISNIVTFMCKLRNDLDSLVIKVNNLETIVSTHTIQIKELYELISECCDGGVVCIAPVLNSYILPFMISGQPYSAVISYSGTVATTIVLSTLPAGLTYTSSNNIIQIAGTPTVNGAYTVNVSVTNTCGTNSKTYSTDTCIAPSISQVDINTFRNRVRVIGEVVNETINVTGTTPITLIPRSNGFGLSATINGNVITVTGTITAAAANVDYSFDLSNQCGFATVVLNPVTVNERCIPVSYNSNILNEIIPGRFYDEIVLRFTGSEPVTVTSVVLPTGLSLVTNPGYIGVTGTVPVAVGSNAVISFVIGNACSSFPYTQQVYYCIQPKAIALPGSDSEAVIDTAIARELSIVTEGNAPMIVQALSTLPNGLSIGVSRNGVILASNNDVQIGDIIILYGSTSVSGQLNLSYELTNSCGQSRGYESILFIASEPPKGAVCPEITSPKKVNGNNKDVFIGSIVNITWNPAGGQTAGYKLRVKDDATGLNLPDKVMPNVTSHDEYIDPSLYILGHNYSFTITPLDVNNNPLLDCTYSLDTGIKVVNKCGAVPYTEFDRIETFTSSSMSFPLMTANIFVQTTLIYADGRDCNSSIVSASFNNEVNSFIYNVNSSQFLICPSDQSPRGRWFVKTSYIVQLCNGETFKWFKYIMWDQGSDEFHHPVSFSGSGAPSPVVRYISNDGLFL
jgi:hypothetical protein